MIENVLAGYAAELGAVGIFALVAMKLGLDYLKAVKGKGTSSGDNGLARALNRLADSTDSNQKAMQAITLRIELMAKDIVEIRSDLRKP